MLIDHLVSLMELVLIYQTNIILFAIFGYFWLDRKTCFHALSLVLVGMFVNTVLKLTFQISFDPTKDFSFPSGHMQTSVLAHGLMFRCLKGGLSKFILVFITLLTGLSLVSHGYHSVLDVLSAVNVAVVMIIIYEHFMRHDHQIIWYLSLVALSTLLFCYAEYVGRVYPHLWICYFQMLGLFIFEYIRDRSCIELQGRAQKWLATIIAVSILVSSQLLETHRFAYGVQTQPLRWLFTDMAVPRMLVLLRWFILGTCMPASACMTALIFRYFSRKRLPADDEAEPMLSV